MDLTQELDALIARTRQQIAEEERALNLIASALHQLAMARGVVISIGGHVRSLREPPPLQGQPMAQPAALAAAEQAVNDEWLKHRAEAAQPRTFANGSWQE